MYQKQKVFTFDKFYEILNIRNNVEAIQMLHETFSDLGSFMNNLYENPDPKAVNINHVFQVKNYHTLVMVKSSTESHSLNIITRSTMHIEMQKGR